MGAGEFDVEDLDSCFSLLLANREAALLAAEERSERTLLAFRRAKVFRATFDTALDELNDLSGVSHLVTQHAPDGYYDPYATIKPGGCIDL